MKPIKRSLSSQRIAQKVLEERGFIIIDFNKPIIINDVKISDVDILAQGPEGSIYAIEVKAGRIDVSGVRQAYTNAMLMGAKPLIIGRGFADDAAKLLADKLGVKYLLLEDLFLTDSDEIQRAVEEALTRVLAEVVPPITKTNELSSDDEEVLMAIASSTSINEAAIKLGLTIEEFARKLGELKARSLLPRSSNYNLTRLVASILLLANTIVKRTLQGIRRDK